MNLPRILPLLLLAPLGAAAQKLPKPPAPPGLPPPPDPVEVVRQFFKLAPPKLEALKAKAKLPDVDLPNALWVARQARLQPEAVLNARLSGLSWVEIFVKFRVPLDTVIIVDDRAHCGPYDKAWGYRHKHGRRPPRGAAAEMNLTDAEISEFIQIRATAGVYDETIEDLAARRCAGESVREIIDDEDDDEQGGNDDGQQGNHDHDHNHDHNHDREHGRGHHDQDHRDKDHRDHDNHD